MVPPDGRYRNSFACQPADTALLRRVGVEWAGVAAARSRAWLKAPFLGEAQVVPGAVKETALPLHRRGTYSSGGIGNVRRRLVGQWSGGQDSGKKIV